jgi:WD40 repeat protein
MLTPKEGAFEIIPSQLEIQDSPILSLTVIKQRYIVFTCMSGRTVFYDTIKGSTVAQRKDHSKYVVQVAKHEDEDENGIWLATAGWDGKVLLYHTTISRDGILELHDLIASIPQLTSPEGILFVRNPSDGKLYLIVTRRDSSFLYYYQVPSPTTTPSTEVLLAGRQNLAPHSNAWVAFTPSAIAPHPSDSTLIAVATSSVPHMKLLIVRLLFPSPDSDTATSTVPRPSATSLLDVVTDATHLTAASQGRAALVLQEREAAAISIHATTMATQTQYSTPALAWRPDSSGVWVNSDDGVVRGIEVSTGKVVGKLDGGHEPGSKIRCLYAGYVGEGEERREVLVSGGFDQRLLAWWPEI